jgi:hypothetical protein
MCDLPTSCKLNWDKIKSGVYLESIYNCKIDNIHYVYHKGDLGGIIRSHVGFNMIDLPTRKMVFNHINFVETDEEAEKTIIEYHLNFFRAKYSRKLNHA